MITGLVIKYKAFEVIGFSNSGMVFLLKIQLHQKSLNNSMHFCCQSGKSFPVGTGLAILQPKTQI